MCKRNSKYTAVIFDLFGTLVDSYSIVEFNGLLEDLANLLGVPKMDFFRSWVKAARESMLGRVKDTEESVLWICGFMGIAPSSKVIREVVRKRLAFERKIMINPRPDALEVLKILKRKHYKLGLISDCTIEAPLLWKKSPISRHIDFPIFSSKVQLKKPDPRIYHLALEKLEVSPESTVYVGDGSSRELTGALNVGMYPIKVLQPRYEETPVYSVVPENWDGISITSFYELLHIIESK